MVPREKRLRLDGLDLLTKTLAMLGFVVLIFAAVLILLIGFGWEVPGGTNPVMGLGESPRAATILAYAGLGIGAAGGAIAVQGSDRRLEWLLRVGIGGVIAALAGTLADAARLFELFPLSEGLDDTLRIGSWVAFACGVAVAAIPPSWARRVPALVAAIAVAPFAVAGGVYLVTNEVSSSSQLGLFNQGLIALSILSLVVTLGLAASILFLWQAVAGVRATQATAGRIAHPFISLTLRWLVLLLALKLAWLALGYSGHLPDFLGGNSDAWADSRYDGLASWILAAAFAGAAVVALRRTPLHAIETRGLRAVVAWVTVGFTGLLGLAVIAMLAWGALGVFDAEGPRGALVEAVEWLRNGFRWASVISVYAATAVALGLLAMRRRWAGLSFLVVFAVWALPRAIQATPGLEDEAILSHLGVNVVTFDTLLTVALAGVALSGRWLSPAEVVLVLVASTLIADSAVLIGSWDSTTYFYVALVLPAAFLFLYDAADLNRDAPGRPYRVLAAVSLSATLLAIVAVQAALGQVAPGQSSQGELVRAVMAVPLAGVLVASSIASLRAAADERAGAASRRG